MHSESSACQQSCKIMHRIIRLIPIEDAYWSKRSAKKLGRERALAIPDSFPGICGRGAQSACKKHANALVSFDLALAIRSCVKIATPPTARLELMALLAIVDFLANRCLHRRVERRRAYAAKLVEPLCCCIEQSFKDSRVAGGGWRSGDCYRSRLGLTCRTDSAAKN